MIKGDRVVCTKCKQSKSLEEFPKAIRNTYRGGRGCWCKQCESKRSKVYRDNHLEITRRNSRQYYREHKEEAQNRTLIRVYGITLDQYKNLLQIQEGKCPICKKPLKAGNVDHSHATNKVRGILCQPCNAALGMIQENMTTLSNMALYLLRDKCGLEETK